MGFKDRLKEAREAKGLKQIDLSAKCGLSKGAVSNYEAGISFPNIATLYKIFDILGVDPNYLFQDEVKIDNRRGALSSREIVLLNKYSKLHSIDQAKVDTYIDDLLENRKYIDNNSGRNIKYFIGHNAAFGGGASTSIQSEDDKRQFYADLEAAKEAAKEENQ